MPTASAGFGDGGGALGRDLLVQYGPTLLVRVGFDSAFDPGHSGRPNLPETPVPALVDTGASESCIDSDLAAHLGLPIVDRMEIGGVHGLGEVNVHLAQIYVPDLAFTIYGQFASVHLAVGGLGHSAIIGRDFLQFYTMTYEGRTGVVTIGND